eukprot:6553805-Pyramimonas_sp.AAC.1
MGTLLQVGSRAGEGFSVNVPFTVKGLGNWDYLTCLERMVLPIMAEFDPDLLIVSAGFDAALGDPLGGMRVTAAGYAHMTQVTGPSECAV